jgi:hypothetical protein
MAVIIYAAHVAVAELALAWVWRYASRTPLLMDARLMDERQRKYNELLVVALPLVFALSMEFPLSVPWLPSCPGCSCSWCGRFCSGSHTTAGPTTVDESRGRAARRPVFVYLVGISAAYRMWPNGLRYHHSLDGLARICWRPRVSVVAFWFACRVVGCEARRAWEAVEARYFAVEEARASS